MRCPKCDMLMSKITDKNGQVTWHCTNRCTETTTTDTATETQVTWHCTNRCCDPTEELEKKENSKKKWGGWF
jgi:hypothetical protein